MVEQPSGLTYFPFADRYPALNTHSMARAISPLVSNLKSHFDRSIRADIIRFAMHRDAVLATRAAGRAPWGSVAGRDPRIFQRQSELVSSIAFSALARSGGAGLDGWPGYVSRRIRSTFLCFFRQFDIILARSAFPLKPAGRSDRVAREG